jgi:hypothetical protein
MPGFKEWVADENLDRYCNPRFNTALPPSPHYKTAQVYQSPRSVQIGFKVSY